MTSKKTQAFVLNFLSFALFFIIIRYLLSEYTHLQNLWLPASAAIISSILAPKFKATQLNHQSKINMSWLFFNKSF